jgi:hypothetical protein
MMSMPWAVSIITLHLPTLSARICLIATWAPVVLCLQRSTLPKPPCPSTFTTSYSPKQLLTSNYSPRLMYNVCWFRTYARSSRSNSTPSWLKIRIDFESKWNRLYIAYTISAILSWCLKVRVTDFSGWPFRTRFTVFLRGSSFRFYSNIANILLYNLI